MQRQVVQLNERKALSLHELRKQGHQGLMHRIPLHQGKEIMRWGSGGMNELAPFLILVCLSLSQECKQVLGALLQSKHKAFL